MSEEWRDIDGHEGLYQVSNTGKVKSLRSGKILKTYSDEWGYRKISLGRRERGTLQEVSDQKFADIVTAALSTRKSS